jgi:hypothetical protein
MPDITISYLVEPQKMASLLIEGISLEPTEIAAIRLEIERNYAVLAITSFGKFFFRTANADGVRNVEFDYQVKKHKLSSRDRSIYFYAKEDQGSVLLSTPGDAWSRICDIALSGSSDLSIESLGIEFHRDIADPMFRYALLGKLLTASIQVADNSEGIQYLKRIVQYLGLIDEDIEMIEHRALAIVGKRNARLSRRVAYEMKSPCRCRICRR